MNDNDPHDIEEDETTYDELICRAKDLYGTEDIEIEDEVDPCHEGAWVSARVWVPYDEE